MLTEDQLEDALYATRFYNFGPAVEILKRLQAGLDVSENPVINFAISKRLRVAHKSELL